MVPLFQQDTLCVFFPFKIYDFLDKVIFYLLIFSNSLIKN
jgi:hypothetical protein